MLHSPSRRYRFVKTQLLHRSIGVFAATITEKDEDVEQTAEQ